MREAIRAVAQTTFASTGILREKYVAPIEAWLSRPEIIVVKGVRRCGKSIILQQVASRLQEKAAYVNFDDYRLLMHLDLSLLDEILAAYPEVDYFFFDEVQKIPQFESWLRTHYDIKTHKKFIISGSSISLLSPGLGTVLTGRNITFEVFPLDFAEFCTFGGASLETYLEWGGFPEVVLEPDPAKKRQLLTQYFNDILLRDILEKHGIAPTQQFKASAQYILANTGLKISANRFAKELGINSRTAENYLSHMIDAYLIFEVPFFSHSAKTKYRAGRASKYYSIDNGLTTALSTRTNRGHLFEAAVAHALRGRGAELYHWSGSREVDFVQGDTAYQATLTSTGGDAFAELSREFKHIKRTVTVTPAGLEVLH
ncbi:ATP-binding protein [Candidatus Woesearchaeota archaeon]|nr:ATP-binding protein [Candidatus Woesearchaeota archaeon]